MPGISDAYSPLRGFPGVVNVVECSHYRPCNLGIRNDLILEMAAKERDCFE